jgi:hypothetical protein
LDCTQHENNQVLLDLEDLQANEMVEKIYVLLIFG